MFNYIFLLSFLTITQITKDKNYFWHNLFYNFISSTKIDYYLSTTSLAECNNIILVSVTHGTKQIKLIPLVCSADNVPIPI